MKSNSLLVTVHTRTTIGIKGLSAEELKGPATESVINEGVPGSSDS